MFFTISMKSGLAFSCYQFLSDNESLMIKSPELFITRWTLNYPSPVIMNKMCLNCFLH